MILTQHDIRKKQGDFNGIFKWVNYFVNNEHHYPLLNIQKNYGKSPFFMGQSTISMVIFNSYVTDYQRLSLVVGRP